MSNEYDPADRLRDGNSSQGLFPRICSEVSPKKVKIIDEVKSPKHLRALIRGVAATRDSTVFKVLERNPEWDTCW